jgi:integrase
MSAAIHAPSSKKEEPANRLYVWRNPGTVIDRNGIPVSTNGEHWRVNNVARAELLNWDSIDTAPDIKDTAKAWVVHLIESLAPLTAARCFGEFRHFVAVAKPLKSLHDITYPVLEAAVTKMRSLGTAWKFSVVRRWYRWCSDQAVPGFHEVVAIQLDQIKVPFLKAGVSVMTRDPKRGPLDEQEHRLLRQAVKAGDGDLIERVCVMLELETGARPSQLVLIEAQDFQVYRAPSGESFYSLDIPRLKQRTVNGYEKKWRRISPDLGVLIQELLANNHRQHGDRGPRMPLLCTTKNLNLRQVPKPLKAQYELHLSADSFSYHLEHYTVAASIISPRTGKLLHLSALRLRHTFGTRHSDQGTPAKLLSELLDHSYQGSSLYYVKSTSNLVGHLNQALGDNPQFTGIVHRFLGRVESRTGTESAENVIPGSTPTLKNLGGIGFCGAGYLCQLYPPLSCYVCPKFVAWVDGPHQQMLEELQIHVQALRQRSGNPSDRIPHQLEEVMETIRAVLVQIDGSRGGTNAPHQPNA